MLILRPLLVLVLLSSFAVARADLSAMPAGKYGVHKPHAYITFSYSHHGFSYPHIGFNEFEVDLNLDNENPENSTVSVTIDATSIDSRVEVFNGHLNGPRFFDTAKFPTITFTSTAIEATGENSFDVSGDLTIKGITKPVSLAAKINRADTHPRLNTPWIGVSAQTEILRSEWGLSREVPLVSDEVTVSIEVELPKAP